MKFIQVKNMQPRDTVNIYSPFIKRIFPLVAAGLLTACDGGGQDARALPPPPPPPATPTAAQLTAEQNSTCQSIHPFYFEIGDANRALTSASVGAAAPNATQEMYVASATKWLFGAYMAEVRQGNLTPTDLSAVRMLSGYVSMGPVCGAQNNDVASCFAQPPNSDYTPTSLDRFNYGSGHYQKWGVDNGLGSLGGIRLTLAFQNKLGSGIPTTFGSPTLAGGAIMSANDYAQFLRKILRNELQISALLGTNTVCTLPGVCATAESSPIPLAWSYSIGHWVEDAPFSGDGSFSSPGHFGFYPWIDRTKTYYGIIAQEKSAPGTNLVADTIGCGYAIRRAFETDVVQ